MDPVTILSIVGATTTIVTRVGTLIYSLTAFASRFRSATYLATRLRLFSETLRQLENYIRQATHLLRRAESTLRLSLISCEDVLAEIEGHVASVNRHSNIGLGILGRTKHLWNEEAVTECERKLSLHLQMLSSYIQLVRLSVARYPFFKRNTPRLT
jgi:hypothetical protein